MPHRDSDRLNYRETMLPGEVLISTDGRFRLYFEDDGHLRLYGYRTDSGRMPQEIAAPFPAPGPVHPSFELRFDQEGLYIAPGLGYLVGPYGSGRDISDFFFVVQSDGNVVVYAGGGPTLIVIKPWNTMVTEPAKYVPPSTPIAEVTTGTLVLNPSSANNVIVNMLPQVSGAHDGLQYVAMPPNGQVGIAAVAGAVAVVESVYVFDQLQGTGPSSPPQRHTRDMPGDAVPAPPGTTQYSIIPFDLARHHAKKEKHDKDCEA